MGTVTHYSLPLEAVQEALIQYISWQCGGCMFLPKSIRKRIYPASWIPWTNQWSITYSGLRLSLICVLDGYQNMGAHQHPPSNSIIIPFTRVLAKVSIRLLRTGQIKPNGLNYSGTSFLEKLMQAQLYAALIFGIFYLLCKSEYLRRSMVLFDHQNTRIAYCTVGHIPARSIRLIIDFQNWTR